MINVDFFDFYQRVYEVLADFPDTESDVTHLLRCLDIMVAANRDVALPRCVAFLKRITTAALFSDKAAVSLALLVESAKILTAHPRSAVVLDSPSEQAGDAVWNAFINDPDHSNALSSNLWELPLMTVRERHRRRILSSQIVDRTTTAPLSPTSTRASLADSLAIGQGLVRNTDRTHTPIRHIHR